MWKHCCWLSKALLSPILLGEDIWQGFDPEKGIHAVKAACREAGVEPRWIRTFGGSDNNVFAQNGIRGLVIATSVNQVHSCGEYAKVSEIAQVAEILVRMLRSH